MSQLTGCPCPNLRRSKHDRNTSGLAAVPADRLPRARILEMVSRMTTLSKRARAQREKHDLHR